MCLTPININKTKVVHYAQDTFHVQQVPCGSCLECKKQRVNSWFVRLLAQLKASDNAYFITLTYDDEKLPYSDNGLMTLNYRDVQLMFKRLRKRQKSGKKISYFCAGEYGSKTHRPHYHMLVFNVDNFNDIDMLWDHGFVHYGDVEERSIYYTLKYTLKSTFQKHNLDPDDDRIRERALMSKGIGLGFLTPAMKKYYNDDVTRPITYLDGQKIPLPRYYRDKLFTDAQKRARSKILIPQAMEKDYERKQDPLYRQRVEQEIRRANKTMSETD